MAINPYPKGTPYWYEWELLNAKGIHVKTYAAPNFGIQGLNINRIWVDDEEVKIEPIKNKQELFYAYITAKFRLDRLKSMTVYDYMDLLTYQDSNYIYDWLDDLKVDRLRGIDPSQHWFKDMIPFKDPTLVEIGEDIKILYLGGYAQIKWVPTNWQRGYPFNDTHLRANTYFIYLHKIGEFELFEYPKDNSKAPIKPKTDYTLFLSTTNVLDLEEECYNNGVIKIVKLFKSANAVTMLERRLKLFQQSPTATNTVLLFQIMDAIIMDKANTGLLDSFLEGDGEKTIKRIEKLKNLALGTSFHEERKVATERCVESFKKLIGD